MPTVTDVEIETEELDEQAETVLLEQVRDDGGAGA
jgi:hypothetical protein